MRPTLARADMDDYDPATIARDKMPVMLAANQDMINDKMLHETKSLPTCLDAEPDVEAESSTACSTPAGHRLKSFSEHCHGATTDLEPTPLTKARPYSAGNVEDLRQVSIAGFAQNQSGVWMFKVEIGADVDAFDSYVVRRRFTDFRVLHHGLQALQVTDRLPELPDHGLFSLVHLFFAPDAALQARAEQLELLIRFVNAHPILSVSAPFVKFLGKNPQCKELGYVSLSAYEAPRFDSFRCSRFSRSRHARSTNALLAGDTD